MGLATSQALFIFSTEIEVNIDLGKLAQQVESQEILLREQERAVQQLLKHLASIQAVLLDVCDSDPKLATHVGTLRRLRSASPT